MRYVEFMIENEDNPIIYLDMDGVLADFDKGYHKLFGTKPKNQPSRFDDNVKQLIGTDFFATLDKLPDADKVVQLALEYGNGKYSICSSPFTNDHDNSARYKTEWIREHLSPQPEHIVITGKKDTYAKGKNVLIDDRPDNIQKWIDRGGIGIWYDAYQHSIDKVSDELSKAFNK